MSDKLDRFITRPGDVEVKPPPAPEPPPVPPVDEGSRK